MRDVELPPIRETLRDYEEIEARIKAAYRKYFFKPLLAELDLNEKIFNDESALFKAIREGLVTVTDTLVKGKFNAAVSKELKALGAIWDRTAKVFRLNQKDLPAEIKQAIVVSAARFDEVLKRIDERLAKILPEKISQNLKVSDLFDKVLFKTDRDLQSSLKNITVSPKLSTDKRKKIADEWQTNMNLWVKDFTEEQIIKLRKDVEKSVFAGDRRKSVIEAIKRSYNVTESKAKFLARQETSLLMAKFKETRYLAAGVRKYRWSCVAGSKLHPVRPWHKILEGKVFTWDQPPITTKPGEPARRNNPGQDYNCRCSARPIVEFNK